MPNSLPYAPDCRRAASEEPAPLERLIVTALLPQCVLRLPPVVDTPPPGPVTSAAAAYSTMQQHTPVESSRQFEHTFFTHLLYYRHMVVRGNIIVQIETMHD